MQQLCHSKPQIIQAIDIFNDGMRTNPSHPIYAQAGKYKCWYAYNDHGVYKFGPSKFIGYINLNPDTYLEVQHELDGKLTEKQLSKFSEDVSDELFSELYYQLIEILSSINRTPGKSVKIKLISSDGNAVIKLKKYHDSEVCHFYDAVDIDKNQKKVSSFLFLNDEVKFDLKYSSSNYIVKLHRVNESDVFTGFATRQSDFKKIKCRALLDFIDGSIKLNGIDWDEDNYNYPWYVIVEEMDDEDGGQ
ncbi:hypothetical protein [Enterobacter sp.]|uniref:hypothetical protein n=1 Tax=Enterobacter sp. TaxID=42895 RepID=UPI00296FBCE2|nr:hypothetical protein [Enterobacter sp.]